MPSARCAPPRCSSSISIPTDPESSGQPDLRAATSAVAANEGVALQQAVTRTIRNACSPPPEAGLEALLRAQEQHKWEINIDGVAAIAFGGDVEKASRAVGLFNGYCARCHTSGWSAGVPFTQEAGSGGFGPALWDGRPNVQFLTPEDLIEFIAEGSVAQAPYGVNGIGSGRMPGFRSDPHRRGPGADRHLPALGQSHRRGVSHA